MPEAGVGVGVGVSSSLPPDPAQCTVIGSDDQLPVIIPSPTGIWVQTVVTKIGKGKDFDSTSTSGPGRPGASNQSSVIAR